MLENCLKCEIEKYWFDEELGKICRKTERKIKPLTKKAEKLLNHYNVWQIVVIAAFAVIAGILAMCAIVYNGKIAFFIIIDFVTIFIPLMFLEMYYNDRFEEETELAFACEISASKLQEESVRQQYEQWILDNKFKYTIQQALKNNEHAINNLVDYIVQKEKDIYESKE